MISEVLSMSEPVVITVIICLTLLIITHEVMNK